MVRALETADRATGTSVMLDLYRQMALSAVSVDLPALWEELGVRRNGDRVSFDNGAPLAQIRSELVK